MRYIIIILFISSCARPITNPVVMSVPSKPMVSISHDACWLEDCMPICFENGGELVWISSPEGSNYNQSNVVNCDHIHDIDPECLDGEYVFECTVISKCEGCPDDVATLTLTPNGEGGFIILSNPECNE